MFTVLTNIRSTKVLWLVEDGLWWKTTLVEDDIHQKTTFGGRQPLVEDNLWWKATFSGKQTWVEDDLRWKMTFSGRHPLVVTPPLDSDIRTEPKAELQSAV